MASALETIRLPEQYDFKQADLAKYIDKVPTNMQTRFVDLTINSPLKLSNEQLKFIIEAAYSQAGKTCLQDKGATFDARISTMKEWKINYVINVTQPTYITFTSVRQELDSVADFL